MQNESFSAADQSFIPDNLAQITDEHFDELNWQDVNADAFTGFFIESVLPGSGPEGVTVFIGSYPMIDKSVKFALASFYSDGRVDPPPTGLHFQRARAEGRC